MKPKQMTLMQRMGHLEREHGSPAHDQLQIWTMRHKDKVAQFLMQDFPLIDKVPQDRRCDAEYLERLAELKKNRLTAEATIEYAVRSGAFVVGFIDVLLKCSQGDLRYYRYQDGWEDKQFEVDGRITYQLVKRYEASFKQDLNPLFFAIEIKPKITSFGETVRQIKHYQSQLNPHNDSQSRFKFCLLTPDQSLKAEFEQAGIICFGQDDVRRYWMQIEAESANNEALDA